jgi:drug/metabolite transporter (DMT)-like permease
MKQQLAVWGLVLNAFVWGVAWWPFRELQARGLHPMWSTTLIYALALPPLLLIWPRAWHQLRRQPLVWVLILAAGMTNVGFNWAVTTGDVVRAGLRFYRMPAWSVLLAWPLLGERPSVAALVRLAMALAGVAIVLKTPGSSWPVPHGLADWLALVGGFSFALTNVLLRRLSEIPDEGRMLAMFLGGALIAPVAAVVGMSLQVVEPLPGLAAGWLVPVGLTSLAFLVANLGLQYGAARLPAAMTSLVMLTEVVFASLSSVMLGAAELQARTVAGGALIVLAALWSARGGQTPAPQ